MAGLLDFLQSEDAQLGMGLLGAAGPRLDGAGFGQRLQEGMGYVQAQKDAKMKREFMGSQMDNYKSEIAQREVATQKAAYMQNMMKDMFPTNAGGDSGGLAMSPGAFSPSADGNGPTMPPSMMPRAAPSGGGLAGISLDKIAALKAAGGPDLMDAWKMANEGFERKPGSFYDKPGGQREYIGDPTKGFSFQNGAIGMMPGAENIAALAGQSAAAVEGAKAGFKPIQVYNPGTQQMEFSNERTVVGGQGGPLPSNAVAPGAWQAANPGSNLMAPRPGESDKGQIYAGALTQAQQQLAQARTPEEKARAQSDIAGIQGEMRKANIAASSSPPLRAGVNFAAGPSADEAARADANKTRMVDSSKAGTARVMTGYDNARTAADSILSNVEARNSLSGGAFVGTGAETKLAISKSLQAIGFNVAPDKVTNSEYLQSTLGQGILNKAKTLGANPTDNDARIIKSIVGSIGTDPNALVKLLDYQDVMSHRAIGDHNKNYGDAKTRGFDAGFDLTVKPPAAPAKPAGNGKTVVQTGMYDGKKVVKYSDGSTDYAN